MSDSSTRITHTRRNVLAGAAAALPLLGRRVRAAGEPIAIGWVGPLSPPGGYAEGTNMKNAAEIAEAEINAQGGTARSAGRDHLRRHARHAGGRPHRGRTAGAAEQGGRRVRRVPQPRRTGRAWRSTTNTARPFMACDVWSDQITAKGYPEVFRNAPAVSLIDVTIGQWIAAAGFKNVAIIAEKNDVGPGRAHAGRAGADQGEHQIHRGGCRSEPDRLHRADPALQEQRAAVRLLPQHLLRGGRLSDDPPGA